MIKSKKFSLLVILFTLSVVCFLAFAGINGHFALAENSVELTISGQTLSLKDNIHIKYAVNADGVADSDTLNLLVWETPQVDYIKGTENTILTATDKVENNEQTLKVFEYDRLSAKQMTDKIYARAYAVVDGVEYYSQVKPYSILEYAYNKLDKTEATPTDDEKLITLINAMLEFGGASQVYNNYALDRLANEEYAYVRIENATFSDGFNYGIYKVGTTEIITPNDGYFLSDNHAEYISTDENGQIILTIPSEKTIDTTSFIENRYSVGLKYSKQGTYYVLTGKGSCTDTDIIIPDMYEGLPVKNIAAGAFEVSLGGTSKITSVTIPDTVISIGGSAFEGCTTLTKIQIPDSVVTIGSRAFQNCTALKNITLPKNLKAIERQMFYQCSALENVEIYDEVTSIGGSAFYECSELKSIKIPRKVTSIDTAAFYKCLKLEKIEYNAINCKNLSEENHVFTQAGKSANGITISIGSEVTRIPAYLFFPKSTITTSPYVTSVEFEEESVCEEIGAYSFYNGFNLKSIEIPSSLISINDYAFYSCGSLTNITLPNNLTFIGNYAFNKCASLTSIEIPGSVTSIGSGVFSVCSSLKTIYCEVESQPEGWDSNWNLNCNAEVVWGYKGQ